MIKNEVKTFLSNLTPGAVININFIGGSLKDSAGATLADSGTFTFNRTSTGRGKGGTVVAHLTDSTGTARQVSSSNSDHILNLSLENGPLLGYSSVEEMPVEYPKNEQRAALIKGVAKRLVGTTGKKVRVISSVPEFNGEFSVRRAVQLRGRNGQVVLSLVSSDQEFDLWTYRHSGIIESFEIISD